jgi:hypothetical protein
MLRKALRIKTWQQRNEFKMNRLSSRQYTMGKYLDSLPSRVISQEVFDGLNQTTARSFAVRGYLEEREVRGVKVVYWNKLGSKAVKEFSEESFERKPTAHFSSMFSLELYDRGGE